MNYLGALVLLILLLTGCVNNSEEREESITKEQKIKIIQLESETITLVTDKAEIDKLTEELEEMIESL